MTTRTDLADLHGFGDLYPDLAVTGARANASGHVVITRPTTRWPFIASPKDEAVTHDNSVSWLRGAMLGLGLLAAAAATVSIAAQYHFIAAARHDRLIAGIEACIPDIGALIFACLGIALALRGKRAIRARVLNAGAIATSVFMNYAAAGHGWRDLAIWMMPPLAYALASDTAIANVRSWALVKRGMADDDSSPLAIVGRIALYLLRFAVAPPSTAKGVRRALLNATPLPAAARAAEPRPAITSSPRPARSPRRARGTKGNGTKTQRLLDLVTERHGALADFPLTDVSKVATATAAEIDMHAGSARTALKAAVVAAHNGATS
jgi:hypothetical protein